MNNVQELKKEIQNFVENNDFDNAVIAGFTEDGKGYLFAITEEHKIVEMQKAKNDKACECHRYMYFSPVEKVNYCSDCDSHLIYWYN